LAPLLTVRERAGHAETVHAMAEHGVRRMPVVDDARLLVGIVTLDDMLHLLAVPLGELSTVFARERAPESRTRR